MKSMSNIEPKDKTTVADIARNRELDEKIIEKFSKLPKEKKEIILDRLPQIL